MMVLNKHTDKGKMDIFTQRINSPDNAHLTPDLNFSKQCTEWYQGHNPNYKIFIRLHM